MMNCKQFQKEMLDALVAGEPAGPSIAHHGRECPDCRAFGEQQASLLNSIGQGLAGIANSSVPPSLLPAVRNQIQVTQKARRSGLYALASAGVVCALAWAVLALHLWRVATTHDSSPLAKPEVASVVVPDVSTKNPQNRAKLASAIARPRQTRMANHPKVFRSRHLEVIVDRKEARELAHLADSVREKPAWGQGFLRQAPAPPQEMTPLPPIEIAQLKVTALAEEKW